MPNERYMQWLKSEEGQEFIDRQRKRAGELRRDTLWLEANRKKWTKEARQKASASKTGSKNNRYTPFDLIVTYPSGAVTTHTFKGETPYKTCSELFGISYQLAALKRGESYTVQVRSPKTKHTWPVGTTVTLKTITL